MSTWKVPMRRTVQLESPMGFQDILFSLDKPIRCSNCCAPPPESQASRGRALVRLGEVGPWLGGQQLSLRRTLCADVAPRTEPQYRSGVFQANDKGQDPLKAGCGEGPPANAKLADPQTIPNSEKGNSLALVCGSLTPLLSPVSPNAGGCTNKPSHGCWSGT